MSKILRKVWTLQHNMWVHRNSFVHKGKVSIHQREEDAIRRVVREEFIIGRNGLSAEYSQLFQGEREHLVNQNGNVLRQWLANVWAGRDRLRREQGLDPWHKNSLAMAFIKRFHKRQKRRMGIG